MTFLLSQTLRIIFKIHDHTWTLGIQETKSNIIIWDRFSIVLQYVIHCTMFQYYTFSDHFIRVKNIELNDCTNRTANDQCWYDVLVNFKVYTLQIEHRRTQGHRSGRPYNFSTTVRWEYDPLTDTELINNLNSSECKSAMYATVP